MTIRAECPKGGEMCLDARNGRGLRLLVLRAKSTTMTEEDLREYGQDVAFLHYYMVRERKRKPLVDALVAAAKDAVQAAATGDKIAMLVAAGELHDALKALEKFK